MSQTIPSNDLYLAVLPVIHVESGLTEQILTLLPERTLGTEFFADDVDGFISMFQKRTKYLSGGHVTGYDCTREETEHGRVIVRVTQRVSQSA